MVPLACDRSEGSGQTLVTVAPASEEDDPGVFVGLEATEADNGPGTISVTCSRTVLCATLRLAVHRATTKLNVSGPGGATIEVNGARVTLPPGRQSSGQVDVAFDFGALSLEPATKREGDPSKLSLTVKMTRRNGAEETETLTFGLGRLELLEVLRASAQRPTVFAGDKPEAAKPAVVYLEPGYSFLGEPKLVRDVDILAIWEPKEKHEGKSCGFYEKRSGALPSAVLLDHVLQDYQLRVVDRRSGKVLLEKLLVAEDGPCPKSFLATPGKPYVTTPNHGEVVTLVEPLRK